jgi:hypothetical protein
LIKLLNPKFLITLSSKDEIGHLIFHEEGQRVNLRCIDFYADFKSACGAVINIEFEEKNKMNYDPKKVL